MELSNIEDYIKKYFEGESTIAEELALQTYFSNKNVAQHLTQYAPLFEFYAQEKGIEMPQNATLKSKKQQVVWLSSAAAILLFLGICTFTFYTNESPKSTAYGTFDTPEKAFAETQKALNLLSQNVNVGVQSMECINEFENSKNKIFKTN
jgi:hypothetical protein